MSKWMKQIYFESWGFPSNYCVCDILFVIIKMQQLYFEQTESLISWQVIQCFCNYKYECGQLYHIVDWTNNI